jgi:hypothetical protein
VVTLHFGKLDPASLDPAWIFSRSFATRDPAILRGLDDPYLVSPPEGSHSSSQ